MSQRCAGSWFLHGWYLFSLQWAGKTVNPCDFIHDFCLYIHFSNFLAQSAVSTRAVCCPSTVNTCASSIALLLEDRLTFIIFLSEAGNFCYCLLKECKTNAASLAWTQVVVPSLIQTENWSSVRREHLWEKGGRYKQLLKAREQQCSSKNKLETGILKRAVLNGNLVWSQNKWASKIKNTAKN